MKWLPAMPADSGSERQVVVRPRAMEDDIWSCHCGIEAGLEWLIWTCPVGHRRLLLQDVASIVRAAVVVCLSIVSSHPMYVHLLSPVSNPVVEEAATR